jgi:PTS system nitrogen regulatory IIA component
MIEMADLVTRQHTILDLKSANKQQVLQTLASLASAATGVGQNRILEALVQRERLGTTGLGGGIAIPHARIPELGELTGFFARLTKPVDFDALDGAPVDLVFLLLAPETANADHLKALARVARVLRDPRLCEALRNVDDPDEAHDILTGRAETAAHQPGAHA